MMYNILFFGAIVGLIIGARKVVNYMPRFENQTIQNRWIWGILSMLFLAIGILVIPDKLSVIRIPVIIFAIFDAMVFFEMTRLAIEKAMVIHDAKNQEKLIAIREAKNAK
ncbi:hypothetical protein RyT2_29720 [Pseudolactococcus yaeyamensis]